MVVQTAISQAQFRACVWPEIAMSIPQMNDMRYYWKLDIVTCHNDFKTTMSRDDFAMIRAHVALRDTSQFTDEQAVQDPLWHCQNGLNIFN
jgi:hypothetical protein